jgi:hypothetical protein
MDSNTHSTRSPAGPSPERPPSQAAGPADRPEARGGGAGLGSLVAARRELAAEDLDRLADTALVDELWQLRREMDGLEGQWLRRLAAVDARGAVGADQDEPALSTASWLRNRLHMAAGVAHSNLRTARALFRGP